MTVEPRFSEIYEKLQQGDRFLSVWFAARCALRALSVADFDSLDETVITEKDALAALRCIICSAVASNLRDDLENDFGENARSASRVAGGIAEETPPPAGSAIDAAALSAQAVFYAFPFDCGGSSALHAREAVPASNMLIIRDLQNPMEWGPIWGSDSAVGIHAIVPQFMYQYIGTHDYWSFWREWYQSFLDGTPLDWELQRRVATIPDADWALGPEHIANLIEEIRRNFAQAPANPTERHIDLEPASLAKALQAPTISAAQIESAAQDIKDAECRYLNDTGANALPEEFRALPGIAQSLTLVGAHIRQHATNPAVEEDLRQEVGRLNARIVELEAQLQKAQAAGESVFSRAFKEQAGKSLGDWKMYAAVLGGVWLVSGDVVGLQERLENLQSLRDNLFGTVSAPPARPLPHTNVISA